MCGRFVSSSPPDELAKYFDVEAVAESVLEPSFNVAPSNDVYVVVETGGMRRLDAFRWGLVPFWAKDPATGATSACVAVGCSCSRESGACGTGARSPSP